ncbi:MAG: cytochrome c biogenesis protein CcsA [Prevotellaceae bacterium]|nr:cytochrome c biogenesis protein CcsA [Prevotellaceae bacterium]
MVVAVATFLPDNHRVYGSWWFTLLWFALALSGLVLICQRKLWRKPLVFSLHLSLVVILVGAFVTSISAKRGLMHLREGIPSDTFLRTEQGKEGKLPCLVRLDSFEIIYYPGTEAPRDYVSHLTAQGRQLTVSVNRIARLGGYRLYQTSFDDDLRGTLLSVNYDPWGTAITYTGYLGFLLSFLASLWQPLFRRRRRGSALALLLFLSAAAKAEGLPTISREKADSIGRTQVVWNNRVCPYATMSTAFLRKVYGRSSYRGLSATQVVASWQRHPDEWNGAPVIKVGGRKYASFGDFIDSLSNPPRLRGVGRDSRTDEKVALVLMLRNGTLFEPLPEGAEPLSTARVSLELLYNRLPLTLIGIVLSILAAASSLLHSRRVYLAMRLVLAVYLLGHFRLLWWLSGHIPLTNTSETLHFIALCLVPWLPLGSSATLAVGLLIERNPQITPLVPVLNSPWLSAHVSCVMLSYALLVVSFFRRSVLRLAVSLLAVGIFLGAVWANVAWGAYWQWDPKEAWALVTLLVYSLPLHQEILPWFQSERNYRLYSLVALAALLMTYFGVNYLLGGLHSYA